MGDVYTYRVLAWWAAGRTGIAKSDSCHSAIHFAAPPQFGGMDGRWTPEHLLLTSLASCFTTTFQALAEHSKFEYRDLQVEAEGEVRKADSGYSFDAIVLRPTLTIPEDSKRNRALALLHKAKAVCMVSKCLAAAPGMEPRVKVCSDARVVCD